MIADLLACDPQPALAELASAGLVFRSHDNPDDRHAAGHYLSGDCPGTPPPVRAARRHRPPATHQRRRTRSGHTRTAARRGDLGPARRRVDPGQRRHPVPRRHPRRQPRPTRSTTPRSSGLDGDQLRRPLVRGGDLRVGHRPRRRLALVARHANLTPTVVYRTDSDGRRIKLEAETLAANAKRTALRDGFADVGVGRPRTAPDGSSRSTTTGSTRPCCPPGTAPTCITSRPVRGFVPHRHQRDAVWRHVADDRNVLLGHEVGAGKTATMVIAGHGDAPHRADHQAAVRGAQPHARPVRRRVRQLYPRPRSWWPPGRPGARRHGDGSSPVAPRGTGTPW